MPASQIRQLTQIKSQTAEVSLSAQERARTDLFFLANVVLGRVYPDLTEKTHRPICEFFVKKDPRKKFFLQDTIKNRLLLDPRGHFKTSIDICDCIQWMLCFPNVTMLLASGSEELTKRMVGEMKEHFLSNGDFRDLFPAFVPPEGIKEFGTSGEFTVCNRTQIRREPTISISTIKSVKAGSHYDIRKGDDVVNEINSATADLNVDTARRWSHTKPLLNPGGYTDLIGTFYDYSCLYGPLIDQWREGRLKGWKVSLRPSLTPDADGELFNPNGILFPERFCVDANEDPEKENLQQIWRDDPELFFAQYQNEPKNVQTEQFPIELLKSHIITRQQVPSNTTLVCAWKLPFTDKKKQRSPFSVCALGGFDPNGNLYIVDLRRGRYTPSQIIDLLIDSWRRWPVSRIGCEERGMGMVSPGLHAKTMELRIQLPVDPIPAKPEDQVMNEVLSLAPLLQQNKLWFVSSCSNLAESFLEFSRYGKYQFDDIPRAISLLLYYRHIGFRPELRQEQEPVNIGGAMTYGDGECGAGIVA